MALASVLALLAGCGGGAYTGAGTKSLPPAEVAVLEHEHPEASHFVISHVDGKRRGIGLFKEYVLTPGEHAIRLTGGVRVDAATSLIAEKPVEVVFNAEAGKRYLIDAGFDVPGKAWGAFVIDKSTGKVVSTSRSVLE
ncbi:hypothetical protein LF41_928 [Lysobacter dokdonensis DS-58]|uniref:Uncharacterized protein n=2 Tax=Noviluteimonas TaxID=3382693 RepID=A0A0A2WJN4_9GAMM|nr:hypothetical protein LF41_928 [Lysobacter dokdonensis DS-58]